MACAAGQVCVAGACTASCGATQTNCGGSCVNLMTSEQHCGQCGRSCTGGSTCVRGQCVSACATGQTRCGGACVNTQTDVNHCGACNNACKGGSCQNGMCVTGGMCPIGRTNCGGTCVNLRNDPNHCGACNNGLQGQPRLPGGHLHQAGPGQAVTVMRGGAGGWAEAWPSVCWRSALAAGCRTSSEGRRSGRRPSARRTPRRRAPDARPRRRAAAGARRPAEAGSMRSPSRRQRWWRPPGCGRRRSRRWWATGGWTSRGPWWPPTARARTIPPRLVDLAAATAWAMGRMDGAIDLPGGRAHLRVASSVSLNGIFRAVTVDRLGAAPIRRRPPPGRATVLSRQGAYALGFDGESPRWAITVDARPMPAVLQGLETAAARDAGSTSPAPSTATSPACTSRAGKWRPWRSPGPIGSSMVPLTLGARLATHDGRRGPGRPPGRRPPVRPRPGRRRDRRPGGAMTEYPAASAGAGCPLEICRVSAEVSAGHVSARGHPCRGLCRGRHARRAFAAFGPASGGAAGTRMAPGVHWDCPGAWP